MLGRAGVFAFLVQKLFKHHYLLKGRVWVGSQQASNKFQHSHERIHPTKWEFHALVSLLRT